MKKSNKTRYNLRIMFKLGNTDMNKQLIRGFNSGSFNYHWSIDQPLQTYREVRRYLDIIDDSVLLYGVYDNVKGEYCLKCVLDSDLSVVSSLNSAKIY